MNRPSSCCRMIWWLTEFWRENLCVWKTAIIPPLGIAKCFWLIILRPLSQFVSGTFVLSSEIIIKKFFVKIYTKLNMRKFHNVWQIMNECFTTTKKSSCPIPFEIIICVFFFLLFCSFYSFFWTIFAALRVHTQIKGYLFIRHTSWQQSHKIARFGTLSNMSVIPFSVFRPH